MSAWSTATSSSCRQAASTVRPCCSEAFSSPIRRLAASSVRPALAQRRPECQNQPGDQKALNEKQPGGQRADLSRESRDQDGGKRRDHTGRPAAGGGAEADDRGHKKEGRGGLVGADEISDQGGRHDRRERHRDDPKLVAAANWNDGRSRCLLAVPG